MVWVSSSAVVPPQFGDGVPGMHAPVWQESLVVQLSPSLHDEPFEANVSPGQDAEPPVHVSATSHWPAAARHTVDDDANAFVGHAAAAPLQFSATSQTPAEARQTVDDDANASAGQAADEPVQLSATSQIPAAARH